MFGGLSFAVPIALMGLLSLPALWWLLKVTPPNPQRIVFPPLKIMSDLIGQKIAPKHTPWWVLLLRILAVACAILAISGPFWQRGQSLLTKKDAPVIVMMETGTLAATHWSAKLKAAVETLEQAKELQRPVALLTTTDALPFNTQNNPFEPASVILERLRTLKPQAVIPDLKIITQSLNNIAEIAPQADVVWIASDLNLNTFNMSEMVQALKRFTGVHIKYATHSHNASVFISSSEQSPRGLIVDLIRPVKNAPLSVNVIARDAQGLVTGETSINFEAGSSEAKAVFDLPVDIRNTIRRIEVENPQNAAQVWLMDARDKRQRVGLIGGGGRDVSQPLLMPTYYVAQALSPFADVQLEEGAVADAVDRLLNARVRLIMMADVGTLDPSTLARLEEFMRDGGVLVRFAGDRLANSPDALSPVRLRRGGREFGGVLSWDKPKTLAAFPANSPFVSLRVPADLQVMRQLMAEPELSLSAKTWASLSDGTPIVTAQTRGDGRLILFHITADPTWSNVPLSHLFVQMLKEITNLAPARTPSSQTQINQAPLLPLIQGLDGFGQLDASSQFTLAVKPITATFAERANIAHSAGWYGDPQAPRAVNVLSHQDTIIPTQLNLTNGSLSALEQTERFDLRGLCVVLLTILLSLDTLISSWLVKTGAPIRLKMLWAAPFFKKKANKKTKQQAVSVLVFMALLTPIMSKSVSAQTHHQSAPLEHAQNFRLAFIKTGDEKTDKIALQGLKGLSQVLSERTAVEPSEPIGLDLSKDELSFFPLIYWAINPTSAVPSDIAIRRLDTYMKNGGTVIFDTKDANTLANVFESQNVTPATLYVRKILSTLDIPELEPLPRDHVLTRAFYLLDALVGRYATGLTWTQKLPPIDDQGQRAPVRGGDGISPLIITSNDWASAWAIGEQGQSLYPIVGGTERQREMAYRGGINLVMYALTGNYKADQVHVAPLLERLGQ